LVSANTAQLVLASRARTSMRRTMPSGPGAVETWMRSPSVFCTSVAAVRSMAAASSRTFTDSTARAAGVVSSEAASASTVTSAQRCEINREPPAAAVPVMLLIQLRRR
jgi:hypothetical protein